MRGNGSRWPYTNDSKGILLFDPQRLFRVTAIKYDFWRGGRSNKTEVETEVFPKTSALREDFVQLLQDVSGLHDLADETVFQTCKRIVRERASNDETHVLGALSRSLDRIELSLSKDAVIRGALQSWRGYFGRWRNTLFHQAESLKYLRKTIRPEDAGQRQARLLDSVLEENDIMRRRLDGIYQAVMSTMSIVESERAIGEAEVVSKLTHLAFFFIPLTLVSGVFGMNVVVGLETKLPSH